MSSPCVAKDWRPGVYTTKRTTLGRSGPCERCGSLTERPTDWRARAGCRASAAPGIPKMVTFAGYSEPRRASALRKSDAGEHLSTHGFRAYSVFVPAL